MTTISKEQLVASAQDFSSRALAAYRDHDERAILHNAAIALEHLSKAYLYSLHPTLLMDVRKGDIASLLFLTGVNTSMPPGKYPHTISAREALTRLQSVLQNLQTPQEQMKQLIDIRDGQLHVGFLAPAPTHELLAAFLRFSDQLYEAMQIAQKDRWGEHDKTITDLIAKSLTEIERTVRLRITAAAIKLQSWIESVPGEQRDRVRATRQAAAAPTNLVPGEEYESTTCPACGDDGAYLLGKIELESGADVEPGDFSGEFDLAPYLLRHFWPRQFRCGICELRLISREELAAAGLSVDEEVTPADPFDYSDDELDDDEDRDLH